MITIVLFVLSLLGFSGDSDEIVKQLEQGTPPGVVIAEWIGTVETGG